MSTLTRFLTRMLKIGCIGFGGGSALIPVIEKELIGPGKLDTPKNYDKDILVANLTPGALPVEIASSLGRRRFGFRGAILGAICMAAPGALATLLLLTALTGLRARIGTVMELVTIAVSAFIIFLIIRYIGKVLRTGRSRSTLFFQRAVLVMLLTFVLSCGKNLYRLLGISGTPPFCLSTFTILVMSFAGIIGINLYRGARDKKAKGSRTKNQPLLRAIGKTVVVWVTFLVVLSAPALAVSAACGTSPAFLDYLWHGCLSALMSFGGGDAYLAIADGLFVEAGFVSAEVFYGDIVAVANILPGSILCKALTGIGYVYGASVTASAIGGLAYALAGFAVSIGMSCGCFAVIYHLYDALSDFRSMKTISHYIGPIISGLLMTVILTLLLQIKTAVLALL